MKVFVSDPLAESGIRIFEQAPNVEVVSEYGLTPLELKGIIGEYDALVIRSKTKVTRDIINSADRLKVIARAGIGLDNVDIPAASQRGIVVMNTPEGNTITTAEHTVALMMALSRNIPQATASLKAGKWDKKGLQGQELFNKILGIVGFGHIGRAVAERARQLEMKVIIHDPYIKPQVIERLDLEPVSFEELLARSDYITIHTPKTKETTNLINRQTISMMKQGAMLINCARGGIVNEEDLYHALKSGHLAGAALDVFEKEPPGDHPLMKLDNFICTPHLGASTREAQDNIAKDVARQVIEYLLNGTVRNAVNVPTVSSEIMTVLRPYVVLMERMGSFQTQMIDSAVKEVEVNYIGEIASQDITPLTMAMLKGLLMPILDEEVNLVNAPYIAAERGIKVIESKIMISEDFISLIRLTVKSVSGKNIVCGTIFGKNRPRIVRINDFYLEAVPEGHLLLINSLNKPGTIGQIGVTMGKHGINIGRMQVGEEKKKKQNIILLTTNVTVDEDVIEEIRRLENVISIQQLEL